MMRSGDVLILDVRTAEEFSEGHIEGTLLLPLAELRERANDIILSEVQTVLVYCRSGRRSSDAAVILTELGFLNVYDFGGISDWSYGIVTP